MEASAPRMKMGVVPAGRDLCTVAEAATCLGVSRRTAYEWARTGHLPVMKIGGRVFVKVAQLRAMIDAA